MPNAEARIKRAVAESEQRVEDSIKEHVGGLRAQIEGVSGDINSSNAEIGQVKKRVTKIERHLGLGDGGA